ncbi:phospholipase effector Tle1 domain-containing protein [Stenotrophomonas sp. NPDC077464]|uniref:phospholipase effector Tle1 domain-containing protein n=1 Tax=unclassified Stenotrophomonas TaxID=196198 RepID=UPI0037D93E71
MGKVGSSAGVRNASADDLRMELDVRQQMQQLSVPMFQREDNANEYVFFAFLDGTGQDVRNPKLGPSTTVGELYDQAFELSKDPQSRIGTHYAAGIGTQQNAVIRAFDGMLASTWQDGITRSYRELAEQVSTWKATNPYAEIRVVGIGYSRGAVQTARLLRLIDEYGIVPEEGLGFGHDRNGNISVISRLAPLVPPGQTAQATLLLDPVATNMPTNFDARLPPSVISRVAIMAAHEQRELFPHQAINDPGMTPDGRAINVAAPGGHSNVGGGNRHAGLEILTGNAAIDYLNTLRDPPLFEKRAVPMDLDTMTVYQAGGATALYGLKIDRDRERNLREALANCKVVDPCNDSEPIDQALAARFEHRSIQPDPAEQAQLQALVALATQRELRTTPDDPGHTQNPTLTRIREGVQAAENQGQVSFANGLEREQFCRSALACAMDNRETRQALYPGSMIGPLQKSEISRVDDVVFGSKGYAFLVQHGSGPHDQQRVPFDIERAKHTPVAVSDQKVEAAATEIEQQQAFQLQHAAPQQAAEPALGGFAR